MAGSSLRKLVLFALLFATVICAQPVDTSTNQSNNNSSGNSTPDSNSGSNSNSVSDSNPNSNSDSNSNSNSNSHSESNSNSTSLSDSNSNPNSTSNSNSDSNSNSNPSSNPDSNPGANSSCTMLSTDLASDCFLIDPNAIQVNRNDSNFHKGLIECPCSPTKSGTTTNATAIFNDIRKLISEMKKKTNENLFSTTGKIIDGLAYPEKIKLDFDKCTQHNRLEACVNADSALRRKVSESICTYDKRSGKNLYNNGTLFSPTYVTLAGCDENSQFAFEPAVNEGCVAVEHLQGYVLQHPKHLRRAVLCSDGFCATPNHALIVRGVMTSMKRLCSDGGWTCSREVRLVNNLKISANRRARINEVIVVTPYDLRFPKVASWIVQIAEDVWNVLTVSMCTGALAGVAVLLVSKVDTN